MIRVAIVAALMVTITSAQTGKNFSQEAKQTIKDKSERGEGGKEIEWLHPEEIANVRTEKRIVLFFCPSAVWDCLAARFHGLHVFSFRVASLLLFFISILSFWSVFVFEACFVWLLSFAGRKGVQ